MARRFVLPFITVCLILIVLSAIPRVVRDQRLINALNDAEEIPVYVRDDRENIARNHPNDWKVQQALADLEKDPKRSIERYDQLISRFPDKPALYAGRVIRYAQIIDVQRSDNFSLSDPQRPSTSLKLDSTLVRNAITAARDGVRIEPDNSFFNYVLSAFLFADRKDIEALAELANGSRKSKYSSHVDDAGLSRMRIASAMGGSPIVKLGLGAGVLVAHSASERQTARMAVWHARRAEQQGDHSTALERYGYVLRMGEQIIDGSHSLIEALVGAAITKISMSRGETRNRPSTTETREDVRQREREMARQFAEYASSNGRPDLASAARSAIEKGERARELTSYFSYPTLSMGSTLEPYAPLSRYLRILVGQVVMVIQAFMALLAAGLAGLIAWRWQKHDHVSWTNAFCVAIISWLPGAALALQACKRVPPIFGAPVPEASPYLLAAALLPLCIAFGSTISYRLWLRARTGILGRNVTPVMPRTGALLAVFSLLGYVLLLVPLHTAEHESNEYLDRMAAGEVQVAEEALAAGPNHSLN